MRRMAIGVARAALNAVYGLRKRNVRRNEAVFLSRQTDRPSYDFSELARALQARGWKTTMHLKKVRTRNLPAYALHVWREVGLLGRCRVAIVDRYDPVISLIDFEGDVGGAPVQRFDADAESANGIAPANRDFPVKPLVLQLWHAFGAFKKFGFQSNDTPEGHTSAFMRDWRIHRNYSYVVCSGENCRRAYAEAFSCPLDRVVAFDRPERDEIAALAPNGSGRGTKAHSPKVLMAPTLRIAGQSAHPFKDLFEERSAFEVSVDADFTWSFHPLDSGLPAPGNVSEALLEADAVVTDYSSIVYEAWLLGIPAFFYVPDLEEYRASPGLNSDPGTLCPALCAHDATELQQLLARFAHDPASYPQEAFDAFAAQAFDPPADDRTAAARLADFIIEKASG